MSDLAETQNRDQLETVAYHYASGSQCGQDRHLQFALGEGNLDRFEYEQAYHHLQLAWESLAAIDEPDPTVYHVLLRRLVTQVHSPVISFKPESVMRR